MFTHVTSFLQLQNQQVLKPECLEARLAFGLRACIAGLDFTEPQTLRLKGQTRTQLEQPRATQLTGDPETQRKP